jgi:hypothetical protein
MDPVTMAMVGGMVNMGVGAITNWLAGSKDDEERRQRMRALQEYSNLAPPEHKELIAREVAKSRMADVRRDPTQEAYQDEVQASLMEVARNGESARAAADYEQAAQDSAQLARSQRMGAVAQAESQGLGPEASFSDSLMAGQADADRERTAGMQRAAYNEEARMGALSQVGGMAAQRSATRWGQDAEQAQAQDQMDIFNAGQWNDMLRYNDQSRYDAFDAQLARADRLYGGHNNLADMNARQGQRTREQGAAIGGGINRAITAPGVYGPSGGTNNNGGAPPAAAAAAPPPLMGPRPAPLGTPSTLQPAMEQQRQIQTGTPTTTPTRRRAR